MAYIPGLWRVEPFISKIKDTLIYHYEKLVYNPWNFPEKQRIPDIVFIGASITRQWMIDIRFPFIRVRDIYKFDKTEAIEEILSSIKPPDIVFLKECAAYFPGDLDKYRSMVRNWCDKLQKSNIRVVLVTVVPVTESHSRKNPGRIEGIWKFNDWLREITSNSDIKLMDFELALSISKDKRFLNPGYAQKDGLHLNRTAYRKVLDPLLGSYLTSIV